MNILWIILIIFLVLAAKAKKIGVTSIGEYIDKVYIRVDAPVDGQLWKEGCAPASDTSPEEGAVPAPLIGLPGTSSA